ncbi:hypothetical protein AVDCRST_MAG84-6262 [uncultured Microcoleus sp.]|uniref:Uncharacterized protein n=1 Tax=uncultured Microcoleus sp. TaxID=259945 RepID=A0A6J4P4T5_9CYAN|nr:hypothetical protein AVDCRST_MAG84-6262 [uncultured Microcoleus sp.]
MGAPAAAKAEPVKNPVFKLNSASKKVSVLPNCFTFKLLAQKPGLRKENLSWSAIATS